jgi:hypothetical protein
VLVPALRCTFSTTFLRFRDVDCWTPISGRNCEYNLPVVNGQLCGIDVLQMALANGKSYPDPGTSQLIPEQFSWMSGVVTESFSAHQFDLLI